MKSFNKKNTMAGAVMIAITLLATSCQKSFDQNSYKPVQTFNGYSTSAEVAPTDLVGYWSFDGNLTDSVSGTSGTTVGTSFTTGIKGKALMGGNTAYTLFTNTAKIQAVQSFTISYWVNTPQNTTGIMEPVCFVNDSTFWGNMDNFFDGQTADGATYKFHLLGSGNTKEAWLTDWTISNPWNTWLFITFTYDMPTETFAFYLNGVQVGTSVQTGFGIPDLTKSSTIVFGTNQFMTTPDLTTGADPQPWASYLLGALDQVRIFDKALAPVDIKALFQLENLGR